MALPLNSSLTWNAFGQWAFSVLRVQGVLLLAWQYGEKKGDIYNILWALVFGFATLNILGLVARRFEPSRSRMSFGEVLAITVVCVSVILLGWEMLYLFHILPVKLTPRY